MSNQLDYKSYFLCFYLFFNLLSFRSTFGAEKSTPNLNNRAGHTKTEICSTLEESSFYWSPPSVFTVEPSKEDVVAQILPNILNEVATFYSPCSGKINHRLSEEDVLKRSYGLVDRLSDYLNGRYNGAITIVTDQEIKSFAQTLVFKGCDLIKNNKGYYKSLHNKLRQLGMVEVNNFKNARAYWYNGRYLAVLKRHLKTEADLDTLVSLTSQNYSSLHGNIALDNSSQIIRFSIWKEGINGLRVTVFGVTSDDLEEDHILFKLKKKLRRAFIPYLTLVKLVIEDPRGIPCYENMTTSVAHVVMDALKGFPSSVSERRDWFKTDLEILIEDKMSFLNKKPLYEGNIGQMLQKFQSQHLFSKNKQQLLFDKVEYYQNSIFNEAIRLRKILKKENLGALLNEKEKKNKVKFIRKIKYAYQKYQVYKLEDELYLYVKNRLTQRHLDNSFTDKTLKNFAKDFISIDGIGLPTYVDINGLRVHANLKPIQNIEEYFLLPLYEEVYKNRPIKTFILNKRDIGDLSEKIPFEAVGKVIQENRSLSNFNLVVTIGEKNHDNELHAYSLRIEKRNANYFIYYFNTYPFMKTNGKLDKLKEIIQTSDGRETLSIKEKNKHEEDKKYQTSFMNCGGIAMASAVNFLKSNIPINQKENIQSKGLRVLLDGLLETDLKTLEEHMIRPKRRFKSFYESLENDEGYKEAFINLKKGLASGKIEVFLETYIKPNISQYKAFLNEPSLLDGDDDDTRLLKTLKKLIDHNYPNIPEDPSFKSIYISNLQ